jgi:sugar phosphate isomerase/epimerase
MEAKMKLGFIGKNDLAGVEEDARFSAEHGFEGLEYNYWATIEELTAETVAEMRRILDSYGIETSSLGIWGRNYITPDQEEREANLKQLERAVEFARMLDASIFIAGGGHIPDASLDEDVAAYADVASPYLEKAQKAGMKVALHAGHGNSFLSSVEAYERLWEVMPKVGMKLDPANVYHRGNWGMDMLRDHGDKVFHMHIKEIISNGWRTVSQPAAGMGDIEWGKIMAFLYEAGYDGYLTIEPHGPIWSRPPLRRTMLLLTQRYMQQFLL